MAKRKKTTEKRSFWSLECFVLLFSFVFSLVVVNVFGLLSFTNGFLLRRKVLNETSSCNDFPYSTVVDDQTQGCWAPKSFSKTVIVLIDALRYDFTTPSNETRSYLNHFPTLYRTAEEFPENAVLYSFLADAPTATLQRIKGLTTGSLPTFIDMGSNFGTSAVEDDNLLLQWSHLNKSIVLVGDDTWDNLYHEFLNPIHSVPTFSLNVPDLHGVDNIVNSYIYDYVQQDHWDVLIAHYLGVDHVGHRLGPDHPAMADKLEQMDNTIKKLMRLIDEDTLLVVMGDHGMDKKGDHGGDSFEECNSALWLYSKRPAFKRLNDERNDVNTVLQVDLAPTLSLLLGNPIPYGSLGSIIPEPFYYQGADKLAHAENIVAKQIARFNSHYKHKLMSLQLEDIPENATYMERYAIDHRNSRRILDSYKGIWAEFNMSKILVGIVVLLTYAICLAVVLFSRPTLLVVTKSLKRSIPCSYALAAGINVLCYLCIPLKTMKENIVLFVCSVSIIFCLSFSTMIAFKMADSFHLAVWDIFGIIIVILHCCTFGSNSFTVWEDKIVHFFVMSFGCVLFCRSCIFKSPEKRIAGAFYSLVFLVLQRLSTYITVCREEQGNECNVTYFSNFQIDIPSILSLSLVVSLGFVIPLILREYSSRYYGRPQPGFTMTQCLIGFTQTLVSIFWIGHFLLVNIPSLESKLLPWSPFLANSIILLFGIAFVWQVVQLLTRREEKISKKTGVSLYAPEFFNCFVVLFLFLTFLQRPLGAFSMVGLFIQILLLIELSILHANIGVVFFPVLLGLLSVSHFFTTGNQATISSLEWNFAFIQSNSLQNQTVSAFFMLIHTFGAPILACLSIPLFASCLRYTSKYDLVKKLFSFTVSFMLYKSAISGSSVAFAALFRRHLMVWKIFAPRYMLSAVCMLTDDIFIILFSYLFALPIFLIA
ncbi:pig-O [Schizosaccharomyces japonicus yFS275]|uniref:Pig-O n=1 Tax=Schizosaccharomyces japonicus (strain yFS275 / FY16936) TaxID=402676 RepID=B6K4F0_SCHJY|nr:pig-O [Schizosaccharomyces japonicus yFS275]EEB08357.1 pig-O [Schizosaccharomyces japonicus yFS275]